ncbi:MAG: GNAT family N-acetyltransferase [Firmicutes bacterium]|nr:GNAT family N-acetyltransferase [Bacillota bacterium]
MAVPALEQATLVKELDFMEIKNTQCREYLQSTALLQKAFDLSVEEIKDIGEKIENGPEPPDEMTMLAMKQDGLVIGSVVFYYLGQVQFGFMELITIREEYRNRGLGSHLYHEMIRILQKKHPELKAMVHEVQNRPENLERRKAFFLNQGAIPIDITFYRLPSVIKDSGLIFMVHPLKLGLIMNNETITRMFKNISAAI